MDFYSSLRKLTEVRVLVVGDIILDRYIWGEVERISPEAPIPVLRTRERTFSLGGAANVAANLSGLGCRVMLAGIQGDDVSGETLASKLREIEIESLIVKDASRPTTIKTRMMANRQQLLRLDEEEKAPLNTRISAKLVDMVRAGIQECDAVILSDYGKGVLSGEDFVSGIISLGRTRGLPVLVDPKGINWERYRNASCVTPNTAELEAVIGPSSSGNNAILARNSNCIRKRYEFDSLLVTRGAKGMCLMSQDEEPFFLDACTKEVFDVSGAGDTVIATLAAGMGAGIPIQDAARLANIAAGVVVGKLGTQPITMSELEAAVTSNDTYGSVCRVRKTAHSKEASIQVQAWRSSGQRIVFTNGCFDILHPGHIHILQEAKSYGDRLVVGMNSDSSVRRIKGNDRPILDEDARKTILAALMFVDMVVPFDQDTPIELIESLHPDVLVKGGDYSLDQVVGREYVESYGGKVVTIPLLGGFSTTALVNKMQSKRQ